MAIPLDPDQLVSFEELLMSQVVQQEAPTRLLVEKGIMRRSNDNLYRVAKRIWVLSWYMPFPGQKYLSNIVVFHSLLAERPFYYQSSLPCKPFYLNFGYRCLQLLHPRWTSNRYSYTYVSANQTGRKRETC